MNSKVESFEFLSIKNMKQNWNSKTEFNMEEYKHIWVFSQSSQYEAVKKTMERK